MTGFFERIVQHAASVPAREALADEHGSISYGEMPGLIEACENFLHRSGITAGAIVGLKIKDETSHVLMCLALMKMRVHQVVLASHESSAYHDRLSHRLQISHIVALNERFDPNRPISQQLEVVRLAEVSTSHEVTGKALGDKNSDVFLYKTTSGTTGMPRIVPLSERQMALQFAKQSLIFQEARHRALRWDSCLVLSSVEYSVSHRYRLRSLWFGATSVFIGSAARSLNDLATLIAKKCVTVLLLSSSEAGRLSSGGRSTALETSIQIGGTRIPWALRKKVQSHLSKQLFVVYATTETSQISVAIPDEHDAHEYVGRPLSYVTVEIVDEAGRGLASNEIGEIRIRVPGMINSYFDDSEETAKRFRDGWFYPGDMASLAEDGQLIIHGRKDDMMNLNSIKIYPAEIERAFETHPEVAAAAAFPIKSKIHGDIPAVALELVKGSALTEGEFLRYARDRLGVRYPRKVIILDVLPRNAIGKVLKTEIAASLGHQPAGDD